MKDTISTTKEVAQFVTAFPRQSAMAASELGNPSSEVHGLV